ncbi:MAG: hypothetical protein R3A51_11985, partial [Nannocystaceae bacterium]
LCVVDWNIDMTAAVDFWGGCPPHVWAQQWIETAFRAHRTGLLPSPPNDIHHALFEQFAFLDHSKLVPTIDIHIDSQLLFWRFITLQLRIRFWQLLDTTDDNGGSWSFEGLPKKVVEFTLSANKHAEAILAKSKNAGQALGAYKKMLVETVANGTGVTSLLAIQCLFSLAAETSRVASEVDSVWRGVDVTDIRNIVQRFDSEEIPPDKDLPAYATHLGMAISHPGLASSAYMRFIRSSTSTSTLSIASLLMDWFAGDCPPEWRWLSRMPVEPGLILEITREYKGDIEQFLSRVSELLIRPRPRWPGALTVQQMQRILKIIRNTDDGKVLYGGFVALAGSSYYKIAGAELICKMLSRSATCEDGRVTRSIINATLFAISAEAMTEDPYAEIRDAVARNIILSPGEYEISVVQAATEFIAATSRPNLTPIQTMEPTLMVDIDQCN